MPEELSLRALVSSSPIGHHKNSTPYPSIRSRITCIRFQNEFRVFFLSHTRINRTTYYLDLTLWACSVGTSLASMSSHFETASLHYLPDLSCGSPFLLALSVLSSFFLLSFCVRVYPEYGTAGEPGAVAGVSGCWRVEGGCKERGRRFRA